MSAEEATVPPTAGITEGPATPVVWRLVLVSGIATAAIAAISLTIKVKNGLSWYEDPDELEQFVAAKMLLRGAHLYRDVFSHHGPLAYMIAHLYTLCVSQSDFSYIRLSQAILAVASCAAVTLCPNIKTMTARIWTGTIYLLLLSSVWSLRGLNQLTYYALSQFLFAIIVAQFLAPAIVGERQVRWGSFASGMASALACFCAYSNGVAVLLFVTAAVPNLFLGRMRGNSWVEAKAFLIGAILVVVIVGLWLLRFGDMFGYFVYHFYFNQEVYAPFIHFSAVDALKNFYFSFAPREIVHSFALCLLFCWLYIFTVVQNGVGSTLIAAVKPISLILAVCGVLFTNPRGGLADNDQGFIVSNFALFAVSFGSLLERGFLELSTRLILSAMLLCATVLALGREIGAYANPFDGVVAKRDLAKYQGTMTPARDAIYEFVRRTAKRDGELLALNWGATVYFKADRLPASGNLFYLPWQAAYNRNPKYGYKMDICADIIARRPAIIWFFNWRVWKTYSIDDYEPCVLSLLVTGYAPLRFDSPWYVRNDLFKDAVTTIPRDALTPFDFFGFVPKIIRPSAPLEAIAPIEILISPTHRAHHVALRRIGIMMQTYRGSGHGYAEVHLEAPNGAEFSKPFSVSSLSEDRYYYFDVDSNWYTTGEIRSLGGEGINTWESHLDDESYTCVIYEYVDKTRRYTPACPIM